MFSRKISRVLLKKLKPYIELINSYHMEKTFSVREFGVVSKKNCNKNIRMVDLVSPRGSPKEKREPLMIENSKNNALYLPIKFSIQGNTLESFKLNELERKLMSFRKSVQLQIQEHFHTEIPRLVKSEPPKIEASDKKKSTDKKYVVDKSKVKDTREGIIQCSKISKATKQVDECGKTIKHNKTKIKDCKGSRTSFVLCEDMPKKQPVSKCEPCKPTKIRTDCNVPKPKEVSKYQTEGCGTKLRSMKPPCKELRASKNPCGDRKVSAQPPSCDKGDKKKPKKEKKSECDPCRGK